MTQSSHGVFQLLLDAQETNLQLAKEASARGEVPFQTKTAAPRVQGWEKLATACDQYGEVLLKLADDDGVRPAGNGPRDNETRSVPQGTHAFVNAQVNRTQNRPIVNEYGGPGIQTNEDKTDYYTQGSSAIDKKAAAAQERVRLRKLADIVNPPDRPTPSAGGATNQPAGSGPRDNEQGPAGGRQVPSQGLHETESAQSLEGKHHYRENYPLVEPTASYSNTVSGDGAGPHSGNANTPKFASPEDGHKTRILMERAKLAQAKKQQPTESDDDSPLFQM